MRSVLERPSESSVRLLGRRCFYRRSSSWNWLLVQSFRPADVTPLLVKRFHPAVGRSLGFVAFRPRPDADNSRPLPSRPLFEFSLPLEFYPTTPSRPAAAVRHLSWAFVPYSTSGIEGPLAAGSPTRYVPPSGFGYPRGGLLPSNPCRFCFTPAALMGFTLRSFLLSQGIRHVSGSENPPAVPPAVVPSAETVGRPGRPRLLGFAPASVPGVRMWV
jgi:hypothetical protein